MNEGNTELAELKSSTYKKILYTILLLYFIINLVYLTRFPFVHSDESWLSGLSRNISETGDFSSTEAFFDLKPRYPHAIKVLFHATQIIFIRILGYGLFQVRLLSLLFGMLSLYVFHKLCSRIFDSEKTALAAVLFLAVDIQFLYASHFARQEIILVFVLILALYFFLTRQDKGKISNSVLLGTIIGLSIGIHPNSFILSLPFGFIYIYHILITKRYKPVHLAAYIITVSLFAFCFVLLSIHFDPYFIKHYSAYGNEFEVFNPINSKIAEVKDFYLKLYYGVSGTYYTPNIKFELLALTVVPALSVIKLRKDCSHRHDGIVSVILSIMAVNAGIIFIGRFNQTSVIFQFPLFFILTAYLLDDLKAVYKTAAATVICLTLLSNTLFNAAPYINNSYDRYIGEISTKVKKDDRVLANLNAEFYFSDGKLYDYRNLAYLKENRLTFGEYVRRNGIKYIIYPEEMDFIYENRPRWNGLYGNVAAYYEDMQSFLQKDCRLEYEFTNKAYGIRIARYINAKDWTVKIYKVLD